MIRETFGAQLPPVKESHVGDRFYNTAEDKHYVFDDGEWREVTPSGTQSGVVFRWPISDKQILEWKNLEV